MDLLELLPPPMREPVLFAIPFFLLLLALEWTAARRLEHLDDGDRPGAGAYLTRDSWASVSMGLVSIVTMSAWKLLALLGYAAIYTYVAPWQLSATQWYTWVIALVGVDLLFYLYHRMAHRVRLVWATHQAHHSSEYFNFATALRQKWNNSGEILMWLPLPFLGVPPWMVFFSFSISLIYQFWIHTERIGTLWRPIEFVFNTPSHHRVHHGMDPEYLDKNYGGILIIWDRLFGTFQPETFRPHYGLTKPVGTFNIWKLQTHEYVAIGRDVRAARGLRAKLGFIFGPPGWHPAAAPAPARPLTASDAAS
ncbi:C-5 sterol desaturase [Mycolicibacterium duvalii]|uniref:C-5 sterol desaturase n=1 Tax=Mycolicibacterium duvalii TaxID=39688 RepID=A0A7I7JXA5_9MYCO|nr:sterol desaturase family protein [Mycolicibacterium duvalii]MCV7365918.1 sterol desaturase family protein [Mycolicibacterium duvalii]PEG35538.1 C-5 sterol desaturase [Mycolicibacterium duvalii]BBX16480.1 C-5 sterol desaturase [Mycolicibacterium duvalii]